MSPVVRRVTLSGAACLSVFAIVAAVLLRLIPGPLRHTDYLVVGSVATLASMAALFLLLINGSKPGALREDHLAKERDEERTTG